ncbi:hypothetical protein B0A52_05780 [Exophiala mesophila]|uniref:mRNA export factor MEX67 n=1 Tax=Exophiala mesophila TaxID=212818 RepID=A0A438N2S3_EXOME|nr:hypothetical protein B0A52_05780 [Exophiala mesophila]
MSLASRVTNGNDSTHQIAVKGWTSSKLSSNKDQGLESLLVFLEKKAGRPLLQHRRAGQTVLIITVNSHDKDRFYHLNGFTFAGATLVLEEARPPGNRSHNQNSIDGRYPHQSHNNHSSQPQSSPFSSQQPPRGPRAQQHHRQNDSATSEAENLIISIIRARYNAADKHLVLNALAADPLITGSELVNSPPDKVWKSIFAMCERSVWETPSKRRESVTSVSLRDDHITSVKEILNLSSVFPTIQNLDLAGNQIPSLEEMRFWKNQFRELEHLILTGNPVAADPNTLPTLLKWYPKLKMYNGEPVAQAAQVPTGPAATPFANPSPIPQQPEPTASHPEFPPGSTFGLPQEGKSMEQLQREQMGLQFSFETRLKMQWVENCLTANNWDYAAAIRNFQELRTANQIPPEAYITGV